MSGKVFNLRKIITFLVAVLCDFFVFARSDYDLKNLRPDSVVVLGGNVISAPIKTGYGYAACGEGKIVSGFSASGTVLWQKGFNARLKGIISSGPGDMLYVVTKDSVLNMLNTSGAVVWSRDVKFDIVEKPLAGRDGRVFVRGKKYISCLGLRGIPRWKIELTGQDSSIPLVQLNDGSFLVFLSKTEGGKSVARRIDPFGVMSEEIVFTGKVSKAFSTEYGVLLLFTDGTIGMCSVSEEKTYSRWISDVKFSSVDTAVFVPVSQELTAVVFSDPARAVILNVKNGSSVRELKYESVKASAIQYAKWTSFGLVLADKYCAECISLKNETEWTCRFNPYKKWSYLYVTDSGFLSLCTDNWVVEMYRMKQAVGVSDSFSAVKTAPYRELLSTETFFKSSDLTGRAITPQVEQEMRLFFSGHESPYERRYIALLENELNDLYSAWFENSRSYRDEKPYFRKNISYNETVLTLCAESGIYIDTSKIAKLIRNINDDSLLLCLVKCAGMIKFDPDGELLNSLDYILKNKVSSKNTSLLNQIADATYEICAFMGRPAFLEQGKSILGYMLYPQFDAKTKEKARNVLNQIVKIKL